MIISHKYKFIFVKTRKTAGSSVEKVLSQYLGPNDIRTSMPIENISALNISENAEQHIGRKEISNMFPEEWKNYYKFTIERNPWDKTVSAFYFYKDFKPRKTKDGFNFFVTNPKSTVVNDWQKYTKNDKICVDRIIEYDNLHNEFAEVCSLLGIPYNNELKRTYLKGQHRKDKNYRSMYNDEIKNVISRQYEKPINYFNYKF